MALYNFIALLTMEKKLEVSSQSYLMFFGYGQNKKMAPIFFFETVG
jgi:hypothetical protein